MAGAALIHLSLAPELDRRFGEIKFSCVATAGV